MIFLVNLEYNFTWFNVSSPDSGRLLLHTLYLIQSVIYIGSLFCLPDIILSLSPSISLHVWAVGWVGCINIICELTRSNTWYLSDKIIALIIHSSWVGLHIHALGCYALSFVVVLHNELPLWKFKYQLQLNRCTRKFSTLPFQINDIQITT